MGTRATAYVASALAALAMGAALVTARPAAAGPVPEDAIRRITVVHNGITIHDRQAVPHPTGGAARRKAVAKAPLRLQDHGNPVRYRNIWVVELDRRGPRLRRP